MRGLDVSHLDDVLFFEFSWGNSELVVSLKLGWDLALLAAVSFSLHSICSSLLPGLLEVELALVHDNFSGSQVLFSEVNCRSRHVLVDDFRH